MRPLGLGPKPNRSGGAVAEANQSAQQIMTDYYVLSVSTRANSFGYFGVVLMNPCGHGVEALYSPYCGGLPDDKLRDGLPARGARVPDLHQCGFVSPRSQGYTTPAKARRVIRLTLQTNHQFQ